MKKIIFAIFLMIILISGIGYYLYQYDVFSMRTYIHMQDSLDFSWFSEEKEKQKDVRWLLIKKELEMKEKTLLLKEKLLDARKEALDEIERRHKLTFVELKNKEHELFLLQKKEEENKKKEKDRNKNVTDIALKIVNIEPQQAIKILNRLDVQLLIDLFQKIDEIAQEEGKISISSYLISLMSPQKVEKMIRLKTSPYIKDLEEEGSSKSQEDSQEE